MDSKADASLAVAVPGAARPPPGATPSEPPERATPPVVRPWVVHHGRRQGGHGPQVHRLDANAREAVPAVADLAVDEAVDGSDHRDLALGGVDGRIVEPWRAR